MPIRCWNLTQFSQVRIRFAHHRCANSSRTCGGGKSPIIPFFHKKIGGNHIRIIQIFSNLPKFRFAANSTPAFPYCCLSSLFRVDSKGMPKVQMCSLLSSWLNFFIQVLCYGSGLTQAIFALALKKCNGKVPQTLLRNPKLPWVHERSGDPGVLHNSIIPFVRLIAGN